ncbi:MAG: V-type ATP synthase subunit F [Thermoprotei archaeon]
MMVAFMGSEDMALAFRVTGAEAFMPSNREDAISTLHDAVWSSKYSFIIIGDPWSTQINEEIRELMQESPIPIVVLEKNSVDTSVFLSSLSQIVGRRIV